MSLTKVLVTGGAGFIGSNLCEYLLAHDYDVICLDNFSTGKPENIFPFLQRYPNKFKVSSINSIYPLVSDSRTL